MLCVAASTMASSEWQKAPILRSPSSILIQEAWTFGRVAFDPCPHFQFWLAVFDLIKILICLSAVYASFPHCNVLWSTNQL
jgi:hypothetical protein